MADNFDSPHPLRTQGSSLAHVPSRGLRQASPSRHAAGNAINMSPSYFWWVFRQWWMVLIPVILVLAAVAATVIMLTYEPDYRASAMIKIEEQAPYIAFPGGSPEVASRYVQTQVELMRSSIVLDQVLADPAVAAAPEVVASQDRLAYLQKNLFITRVSDSDLFNVSFLAKSPEHAARVSNLIVGEYLEIQLATSNERYRRVIELLDMERHNRQLQVEAKRKSVLDLSGDVTGFDPFGFNMLQDPKRSNSPLVATEVELTKLEVEKSVIEAQLQALRESPASETQDEKLSDVLDFWVSQDSGILELEQTIRELEHEASEYREYLVEDHDLQKDVKYQRIQNDLARAREMLEEENGRVREKMMVDFQEGSRAQDASRIRDFESQLEQINVRREHLDKKFNDFIKDIGSGNAAAVALTFAEAELKREEKVFEMIESRRLAMQTESKAPPRVTVLREAEPPPLPVTKVPYKLLLLACLACIAAPYGLAVLRELSIRRVTDVEQLSRETTLRVVGEVSHFPIRRAAANGHMLPPKLRRQMFVYLESIDSLRTNLALTEPKGNSRVVVVTSAAAAEGKTCLATSLAVSIANAENRPTLVIDGDMRSPDVASVLGTRDRPGLAELLSNQASLSDVVQRVGKTNTYVIAAGRLKGNPHHVIREERLGPLISQLRGQFSTIVIDTPPIFGGSESLVFAKHGDSVLLSVMRDVSRLQQLNGAIDRLERAGATIAGTVLNGTSSSSYAYNYGYGYYSGRLDVAEE
jgi:succinoglycan biosynthesis transport protein ExoP